MTAAQKKADSHDYVVKDIGLAEWGRKELAIAETEMPGLMATRAEFGPTQTLKGTIGGTGWSLTLRGARQYGNPMHARFQGVGIVKGEKWVYDYDGYLVPDWPNGVDQIPAIVGSVVRTIPHSGSQPGTVNPAGVVCSFYAVRTG